jgi:hypothetical protein
MERVVTGGFKPVKLNIQPSGYSSVPTDRLNELFEKEAFLEALKACGVDTWTGYIKAVELWEET